MSVGQQQWRALVGNILIATLSLTGAAGAIEQQLGPSIPGPAVAAPAAPEEVLPTPTWPFDFAFGAALTTDYVSRGITNSDSRPAIQGYVEPSFGPLYANVWSSNVDYGDDEFEGAEIDTAIGFRPEFGPWSVNVGYVHYFYSPADVSPDYGELFAKADYNFQDLFTIGARLFFAPDFNQSGKTATFIAGGVKVPLPHDFAVYGGIGYQFFEDPDAFEQLAWTAGLSYTWKAVTFDVRYWDTDLEEDECAVRSGFRDGCDARIVGTVSIDTSWSALKNWMQ
jgi:uncharacterized protein (TIGR02001 family)